MHFTYQRPKGELQQGDLLKIEGALRTAIKGHHPDYVSKPDYRYLMVLTQSCDLVRRNGRPCKARYITLAAVRPFDTAMRRELIKHQMSDLEKLCNLCSAEKKYFVRDFLIKLLNNNYPGYFFLASEPELGIYEDHVAFLTLSIAIKSGCYDKCMKQRLAQLQPVSQAKLGWLVGNEYSRIGTPDWTPEQMSKDQFRERIEQILDSNALWVGERILQMLKDERNRRRKQRGDSTYQLTVLEAQQLVVQFARQEQNRKQLLVQLIVKKAESLTSGITPEQVTKLNYELLNSPEFERLIS